MRSAHASVCKSARSHYSLLDFMYPVELIRDTFLNLITSGCSAGGFLALCFRKSSSLRAEVLENNTNAD